MAKATSIFHEKISLTGFESERVLHSINIVSKFPYECSKYVFTKIKHDENYNESEWLDSWVLRCMSECVIKSLYLNKSFISSYNSRNTIGCMLPIKALWENVGYLAGISEIYSKSETSFKDRQEQLKPYVLGNRGKSDYRIGNTDSINVITLLEKADKYLHKMSQKDELASFFSDAYDIASNASHPSFDSHNLFGEIIGNTWSPYPIERNDEQFTNTINYSSILLCSYSYIHLISAELLCSLVPFVKKHKINYFFDDGMESLLTHNKEEGGSVFSSSSH